MSEESEPDWELLARDPLAFFALDAGYERDDLRRAYGKWIRRFRPETHPAEFQRLRAAYEKLEAPRVADLGGELSADDLMQHLSSMLERARHEEASVDEGAADRSWLRRALQEDHAAGGADLVLVRALLRELEMQPGAHEIVELLRELLATEDVRRQAPEFLGELARSRTWARSSLAWPLWASWLAEADVGLAQRQYERWVARADLPRDSGEPLLRARILGALVLRADLPWIHEQRRALNELGTTQEFPELEHALELLELALAHRGERERFLDRSARGLELRKLIDAAMAKLLLAEDDDAAARELLHLRHTCSARGEELLAAFAPREKVGHAALAFLELAFATRGILNFEPRGAAPTAAEKLSAAALLQRIEREANRNPLLQLWAFSFHIGIRGALFVSGILGLRLILSMPQHWILVSLAVLIAILGLRLLLRAVLRPDGALFEHLAYRSRWRPLAFEHLRASRHSWWEMLQLFEWQKSRWSLSWVDVFLLLRARDLGLRYVALLARPSIK
jgi:hypothetical protein